MNSVISTLLVWQLWAMVGVVLCAVEMFTVTPGFYLLTIGIGCFIASAVSLVGGLSLQIVFLIIGSVGSFFLFRRLLNFTESKDKFGVDGLIGQRGNLIEVTAFDKGYVKVGGESWPARSIDGATIQADTQVEVVAIDGNKLKVKRA